MAGKNGRFNKFLQTIGIVDDPVEEEYLAGNNRDYYGHDQGAPSYRTSSRDGGMRDSGARDNRYESPFGGYNDRDNDFGSSSSRYNAGNQYRQQNARPQQRPSSAGNYAPRGNVTQMPLRGNFQQEPFSSRSSGRSNYDGQQQRASGANSQQRTVIYAIRSLEECQHVIIDLIEGKTTVINLEDLRSELMQRAVDTLAGASFALNAELRKASDKIYLIAPRGAVVDDMGAAERRY